MSASKWWGARAAGQGFVVGQLLFAVDLFHRRRIPLNIEGITSLLGLPIAFSHDRHAFGTAIKRHAIDRFNSTDGACCAVIQSRQPGAEYRGARHHGGELLGQAHVNPEILLAAALGLGIDARRSLANDAKILGVLEADLVRYRHCHRDLGQFAVARGAAPRAEHVARAGI